MSLIDREALIAEYDRVHVGAPGGARKLMVDAPEVRPDDAALHESCTDCPLYDHDRHRCPRFNKVIPTTIQEILDTQTQRWIPVTERLPGEDDYRPCYGYEDGAVWWVNDIGQMGLGWYYPSTGKWAYYDESDGCDKCVGNVVAWMPLPEPARLERD